MTFSIINCAYQDDSEIIGEAFITQQELIRKFEKKEFDIKL